MRLSGNEKRLFSGLEQLLPDSAGYLTVLWLGLEGLYLMDAAAWIPVALFLGLCYHRLLKQKLSAPTVGAGENMKKEDEK